MCFTFRVCRTRGRTPGRRTRTERRRRENGQWPSASEIILITIRGRPTNDNGRRVIGSIHDRIRIVVQDDILSGAVLGKKALKIHAGERSFWNGTKRREKKKKKHPYARAVLLSRIWGPAKSTPWNTLIDLDGHSGIWVSHLRGLGLLDFRHLCGLVFLYSLLNFLSDLDVSPSIVDILFPF